MNFPRKFVDRAAVMLTAVLLAMVLPAASLRAQATAAPPDPGLAYAKEKSRPPSEDDKLRAEQDYVDGARALNDNNPTLAEKYFLRAAALVPGRRDYAQAAAIAHEHRVTGLVQQAAQMDRSGKKTEAQKLLDQAEQLDPENRIVQQHMQLKDLEHLATTATGRDDAARLLATVSVEPPEISAQPSAWSDSGGPVEMKSNGQMHSFHESGNCRVLLPQVLAAYGIKAEMDDSVNGRMVRLDVDNLTAEQIIPILDELVGVFVVPLDEHTVVVGRDQPQVHARLDPELYETVFLPGLSADDLKSAAQVAREVFGIQHAAVSASHQTMSVRAPEETLVALNRTLSGLLDNESEVLLEISLYEVDRTNTRQTGIQPPQQITAFNFDSEVQQIVQSNQSVINQAISSGLIQQGNYLQYAELLYAAGLLNNTVFGQNFALFGNGLTRTGISGVGSTLNMALNSSDSRMVDATNILAENKQEGTFRAGERYPIITSTYSNLAATGTANGVSLSGLSASQLALLGLSGVSALASGTTPTIPQIQYEDLGLTLNTTPKISRDGNISLHFELKLEALSGSTANDIPILNSRDFSGDVMVRDGQDAVIMSSVTKEETGAINGTPGLNELPGFSDIANKTLTGNGQDVVLVVRPHLLRHVEHVRAGPMVMLAEHGAPAAVSAPPEPAAAPTPAEPENGIPAQTAPGMDRDLTPGINSGQPSFSQPVNNGSVFSNH